MKTLGFSALTTSLKALTLQNIERTIHYAFHKIDSSNPLTRQKIYKTIWSTHERLLMSKKQLNNSEKAKKRKQLILLLKKIEKEYHLFHKDSNDQFDFLQREEGTSEFKPRTGPEEDYDSTTDFTIFTKKERSQKSFWLPICLLALIVLGVIVFFSWSFYSYFSASNLPSNRQMSETTKQTSNKHQNEWTQIFDPSNVNALAVRGAATTEVHNEAGISFVRIQTETIGDIAIIEVGQSALMKLRGKTATIGIMARGVGRTITKLNLVCDFGVEKNVEKQWFELSQSVTPLLFQVHIPHSMSIPVKIYINSSLSNRDHGIDIFSILVKSED